MNKQEVWFGKVYNVIPDEDRYLCEYCCFNDNDRCKTVKCVASQRTDKTSVYFTEVVPEDDVVDSDHNAETSKNWQEVAAHNHRDATFYQGIVDQIGVMFGIAAFTSDDGSIQDSVLRTKVPELVAKLVYDNTVLNAKVSSLKFSLDQAAKPIVVDSNIEMQNGVMVHSHPYGVETTCRDCCFYGECSGAKCTEDSRLDGTSVFFTKV